MSSKHLRQQAGATLVEVLIAIALTGIMLPALATALVAAHAGKATSIQKLQAQALMTETAEALRSVREQDWGAIATNGTYHPIISGSAWSLASGSDTVNTFSRKIVIGDAERDSSGTLVASGGTIDPSTKHITITIAWDTPTDGSINTDSYLTRWQHATAWTQSTAADFGNGSFDNTTVSGNSVELQNLAIVGTFESVTFDAGSGVGFTYLNFTASVPGNASLKLQVAANDTGSGWSYVGPDGTGSSYYTSAGSIPLALANHRYLRYKAYLTPTSDATQTPALNSVEVTYTP